MAGVAVLVLACYAPVLGAPFVWDDHELIQGVHGLTQSPWWSALGQPFWSGNALSSSGYFRPVVVLSFRFDAWLFGDNSAGYHLMNVLVHASNAVMVAVLGRRHGAASLSACAAALGFALAPRLSESVAWISGRTDVLATFFVLLAFLLWPLRRLGPWLAAFALTLGVLSKEVALAGAPALFLLEWRAGGALAARARRLAPLCVCVVAVLIWRGVVLAPVPVVDDGLHLAARAITATEALGDYLGMIVDPWQPNLQIGWVGAPQAQAVALGLAGVGLVALAVFKLRSARLSPYQMSLVTLGVVPLIAVLHLAPLPIKVVAADRFLYLPIAALALGLASLRVRTPTLVKSAALWLGLLSFAAVTVQRVDDWSEEARLWSRAVHSAHPNNPVPLLELGNLNYRVVRLQPAAHYYALAAAKPDTSPVHDAILANAANVSSLLGQHDRALRELQALMNRRSNVAEYRFDFVVAAIHAQHLELAAQALVPLVDPPATAKRASELGALLSNLAADLPTLRAAQGSDLSALLTRARFPTRAGDREAALSAWRRVVLAPAATVAALQEALEYFVVNGELSDVPPTAERLKALGGNVAPALAAAFEFRQKQWQALESI